MAPRVAVSVAPLGQIGAGPPELLDELVDEEGVEPELLLEVGEPEEVEDAREPDAPVEDEDDGCCVDVPEEPLDPLEAGCPVLPLVPAPCEELPELPLPECEHP